jgi:hypothetical protein
VVVPHYGPGHVTYRGGWDGRGDHWGDHGHGRDDGPHGGHRR